MLIQEMSREECLSFFSETRIARLAFVQENQPHIVPVYLVYDVASSDIPSLYGVTTRGEKIEGMRTNPRVCVEVDEIIGFDRWVSVVALGWYEELADQTEGRDTDLMHLRHPSRSADEALQQPSQTSGRLKAAQILQKQAMWWEPAATAWALRHDHKPGARYDPVYYRVCIDKVSGRRACPRAPEGPTIPA